MDRCGEKAKSALFLFVCVGQFVDHMLLTSVVPIVPQHLIALANGGSSANVMFETFADANTTTSAATAAATNMQQIHVGIIFGSIAIAQLMTNPLIGTLTNRIGYTLPLFAGFVLVFVSTLLFAFGTSVWMLLAARTFHGIASAFLNIGGMRTLEQLYENEEEREKGIGLLFGAPYGGLLFAWSGAKVLPFVLLAGVAFVCALLQLVVLRPCIDRSGVTESDEKPIGDLARDPYMLCSASAIAMGEVGWGVLQASLALWIMEKWGASFELGFMFMPASIAYIIGTNLLTQPAKKIGRWLFALIAFQILAVCFIAITFVTNIAALITPLFCAGFASAMVDASMLPTIELIANTRHAGSHRSIYAIIDASFSAPIGVGAIISCVFVTTIGFDKMMYVLAAAMLAFAPLLLFLREIPTSRTSEIAAATPPAVADDNSNDTHLKSS